MAVTRSHTRKTHGQASTVNGQVEMIDVHKFDHRTHGIIDPLPSTPVSMPASTRKRKGPKDKKQDERTGRNKKPRPSKSIMEKNGGTRGLSPVNYTDVEKTANEYKPDIETLPGPSAMTVDNNFFWPDVAFGEGGDEGLSAVGRADLLVSQWESILKTHQKNLPEAIPHIQDQLDQAKSHRESLEADPSNKVVMDDSKRAQAILNRISDLKKILATSQFEPERQNIRGTIAAYRSGAISFSRNFTLVWAGKVVDKAATYGEFTKDRLERLDRYAEKHGPHWLWWESPLWLNSNEKVLAAGCQVIQRENSNNGMGHFFIKQGFWKRSGWVTRLPPRAWSPQAPPDTILLAAESTEGEPIRHYYDPGPKLLFRSLLDSGSTHPCLFPRDLLALGIDPRYYSAQSAVRISTSNGIVCQRAYDIHVEIAGNVGTPLVDPHNPVHPAYPRFIGGLSPVTIDDSYGQGPPINENGWESYDRLSGLMPFLGPYSSITPNKNCIFMGETRNDVLGTHKTPPGKRWMAGGNQAFAGIDDWNVWQDPMITFTHRDGQIVDQDIGPAISKLVINVGAGQLETTNICDPRGDFWNQQAQNNAGTGAPGPL